MRRECLLSLLLAYFFAVSLTYAVPPVSHVPLEDTTSIPAITGEAGQEVEAPEDIIFGASAMDRTFKPFREWPQKVTCYAVFNPYLLGLKRTHVYDAILDDYTLYVYRKSTKRLEVSSGDFPLVYDAEMTVKLEGGKFTSIPSVAPDAEIISYAVYPDIEIEFYKDGADNFYVKPYLPTGNSVTARIKLKMGTDDGYFNPDIPEHLTLEDIPAELRRPVPENVKLRAQLLAERLGLINEKNLRKILSTLTSYFSTFACGVPPPQTEPDAYLAIAEGRQGACSQRAFGFFVTANSIGLPTRLVENECHAFVEVYIPKQGWRRVDLGGCGEAQAKNIAGKEPFEGAAKDSDADGLSDFYEEWVTSTDPNNPDTDGDGTPDGKEDLDGDGLTNSEEHRLGTDPRKSEAESRSFGEGAELAGKDSDGDKLSDAFEEQFTHTNPYNPDTDGDGVADGEEDLDADGLTNAEEQMLGLNPLNPDTDGDGLSDSYERGIAKTDPNSRDTDMDGTPDGDEDPDGDGLTNLEEQEVGTNPRDPDTDRDGVVDGLDSEPVGKDSDNDGLSDEFESLTKTQPNSTDSDGDGVPDGEEDLDGDGLSNIVEQMLGTNPAKRDTDSDGLSDAFEAMLAETDPTVADTDSNGAPDGAEDLDGDGLSNIEEQALGLNPKRPDAGQGSEGVAKQEEALAEGEVSISLNLSSITIEPGEEVMASGRLTSGGKGLSGREVGILINGSRVTSVVTGVDGYYEATLNFSAPGTYTVKAVFESDKHPYKSAESPTAVVNVAGATSGRNYAAVIIGAVILFAGIASGVAYYARFRTKPAPTAQKTKAVKAQAFVETAPEGAQKDDYRSKVILVYNRLLWLLNTRGLHKEPNQTHWEFCRRVLGELPEIGDGVRRITALYEEAFYSTHPVEESHYLLAKTDVERVQNVLAGGEMREKA